MAMENDFDKNPAGKTATVIDPKDKTGNKTQDIANKAAQKSSNREKDFDSKQQPQFNK